MSTSCIEYTCNATLQSRQTLANTTHTVDLAVTVG
uniref:Uncharacterized protein n=1 Tax=Anguilla anguilla TaxID=7936 RepID=A0A0E9PV64_ANGAN